MTPRAATVRLTSPREAAAVMMRAVFGDAATTLPDTGLSEHQRDGVTRLLALLRRYGGALLCDSVGLGKTHTAAAVIAHYVHTGSILVTAPAQLKDHWSRHLRHTTGWRWLSHTSLSRGRLPAPSTLSLVVVDEAHAFRNPATRRYASLANSIGDAHVLLITATPVNNSPADLYHLIRLFARDDAFLGAGISDLRGALEAAFAGELTELRRVAAEIMVRRTRALLRHQPDPTLRFPVSSGTELVRYESHTADIQWLRRVTDCISRMSFAAHRARSDDMAVELMRLTLLKRLESGLAAFRSSILRLMALTDAFIDAARDGLFFDVREDAHFVMHVDGTVQLALHRLALRAWPVALDRDAITRNALRDAAACRTMLQATPDTFSDAKLARLVSLVNGELREERTIVFTEFRDTAEAIHRALAPHGRVALIHGNTARLGMRLSSRAAVIRRFAPRSSAGLPAQHRRAAIDDVRVLVATDVLSEGMNLQDARVVISYDLPWNPVRLAQRAGRIDRMASPHNDIRIIAFAPQRGLERMLRLVRTIRRKIHVIRALGGDAPASFTSTDITPPVLEREQTRLEFMRIADEFPAAPSRRAARATMHGSVAAPTLLCCVSDGRFPRVLVMRTDVVAVEDDALAWPLLRAALTQAPPTPPVSWPLYAQRAERAAVRIARGPLSCPRPHPASVRAASVVRRWLASRPGRPSAGEIADAEHALALLQRPSASLLTRLPALLSEHPQTLLLALRTEPAPHQPTPARSRVIASILVLPGGDADTGSTE